ncbi:heme-binding protein [Natronococcus pandeyae]|uniref:Heme-binding protein n=1 Tax=Natronococcus pandeyae TaxID=2055836 RepID=A0A8J8TQ97_9EURY|nr:heme-binding protein [Natronococcus pandeyae]TYL38243.1 heme-binding protein [Natronococcus pandeyae]
MRSRTAALISAAGALLTAWIGWGAYVIKTTERVPYDTLDSADDFEIRRYPQTVLVETTAESENDAFWRLYRYITGENEASEEIAMTAPVASSGESIPMTAPVRTTRGDGESVAMTAPVRTDRAAETVSMAFYLPPEYTPESAPMPTDPSVRLVVDPPQTVAARRFSWYATDGRVERNERALLEALGERGLEARGKPVLYQYNDPWTPPFMRRNEVVAPVDY